MRRSTLAAFTLVELLVVVSIIALLLAILLPALQSARESAKSIGCASNFRQTGLLMNMYALDNQQLLPPHSAIINGSGYGDRGWRMLLDGLRQGKSNGSDFPAEPNSMFICPSLPQDIRAQRNGVLTGIGMNQMLSVKVASPSTSVGWGAIGYYWPEPRIIPNVIPGNLQPWGYVSLSAFRRTSETIYAGDTADRVNTTWYRNLIAPTTNIPQTYTWYDSTIIGDRHVHGVNRLWIDGHVTHHGSDELDAHSAWYWPGNIQ